MKITENRIDLKGEIFKEFIPNYFVSNFGRVYRNEHKLLKYNNKFLAGRFMKPALLSIGYYQILLGGKKYYVHRIVAELFVKNPAVNFKKQVNHIDSNRANNNFTNLEWVSHAENVSHATKNGRMAVKLQKQDVINIRTNCKGMKLREIAEIYNVTTSTIHSILHNKIWKM